MIDTEFYIQKIQQLSDDKLKELLQLRTKENADIMNIAESEAIKRGIDVQSIPADKAGHQKLETKEKNEKGVSWTTVLADILSGLS
jgi:hypothetical protein